MGRVTNVFDLSTKMGGTKFLTDKAHRDGSRSCRNCPEVVKKAADPIVVHLEDRPKTCELRKSSPSKKLGETPMQMLIAQEMSKANESKRKPSNVVARLMGLDEAVPSHSSSEGRTNRGHSPGVNLAGAMPMPCGIHYFSHREREYRDVYEVWQQPPRSRHIKDQYLQKGRYDVNQSQRRMALEKRMAIVRQKFMEAKQLATNEKLLQSKEFEDALEVLSSNRDLFLKFLEEPESLFSKHLKELYSKAPPLQTKSITVLKPSWTRSTKGNIQAQKQQHPTCIEGDLNLNRPQWRSSSVTQPTRIVVLKPTLPKHRDTNTTVIPQTSPSESIERDGFYPNLKGGESRELAKEISRQMKENHGKHRRDESLLSSVLSNGYVGDDSSFARSENEYMEEGANFSDPEIVTPTSQCSWDFANRYESPYSFSSFSRTSCSPEPSMIREARKRLSERCALVASNGFGQEQMEVRRSSSTLGEILATPEAKKEEVEVGGFTVSGSSSCGGEEPNVSKAIIHSSKENDGDDREKSTWDLSRSRSVPLSSSTYDNIDLDLDGLDSEVQNTRLNSEVSDSLIRKPMVLKEAATNNSGKTSFKGKISRLFLSIKKKNNMEKSVPSPLIDSVDRVQCDSTEHNCEESDDLLNPSCDGHPEDSHIINSEEEFVETSTSLKDGPEQGTISTRAALCLEKPSEPELLGNNKGSPSASNTISQNQDQPSPTSVLDAPFEDSSIPSSRETSDTWQSSVTNEKVSRSLSWDDTHLDSSSSTSLELSRTLPEANEEEQRHLFVQSLMSAADLDNENLCTGFTKFYSLDCPLDPNLLDKFLDRKEEDAKSRVKRSNTRLLFDCVNCALVDIDHTAFLGTYPWAGVRNTALKEVPEGVPLGSRVWVIVKDSFFTKFETGEKYDGDLVVDRLVRTEIGGRGWAELMRSEIDGIGREISEVVLEGLVAEALADFIAACLL